MYPYSFTQWILFFYVYCFIGWCFETTYVSLKKRQFINRGFMRGPFLPIYGSGAIVMLVVSAPFQKNLVLVFLSGILGATLLEYVTGVAMEAIFKVRYWDYSNQKLNYQGHICLTSSLAWGAFTIILTEYIHKPIAALVTSLQPELLYDGTFVITILVVADFAIAFKAAIDLRELLIRMEKAKEELIHLQKRLDVIMALVDDKKTDLTQGLEEKVIMLRDSDILTALEDRFDKLKKRMQVPDTYTARLENFKEEVNDMLIRLKLHRASYNERRLGGWYTKIVLRNNPMMKSGKYAAALEELKHSFEKRKSGDNTKEK